MSLQESQTSKIPETEKLVLFGLGRPSLQQNAGNNCHECDAEHAGQGLVGEHVVDRLQCYQDAACWNVEFFFIKINKKV